MASAISKNKHNSPQTIEWLVAHVSLERLLFQAATLEQTVILQLETTILSADAKHSVCGVLKSGSRMSRRIKHHVETVSRLEFESDSTRSGKNKKSAQNNPTIRMACFIGCSHNTRQLQFCTKNSMKRSKILGGKTIVESARQWNQEWHCRWRKRNYELNEKTQYMVFRNQVSKLVGRLDIMSKPCENLTRNRCILDKRV